MGCVGCHQLGNLATRTIPKALGTFKTSQQAWLRRVQSGQAGRQMINIVQGTLAGIPIRYLADWTDRIAAGEIPAQAPERPRGIERNVVATVLDWSDGKAYLHDLSGTDRRNPTVNGNGLIYGTPELSTDNFPVLDPLHRTLQPRSRLRCVTRIRRRLTTTPCSRRRRTGARSASGTAGRSRTIRCWIAPAASGTPRESARRTIRPFAKRARRFRLRESFPDRRLRSPTGSV